LLVVFPIPRASPCMFFRMCHTHTSQGHWPHFNMLHRYLLQHTTHISLRHVATLQHTTHISLRHVATLQHTTHICTSPGRCPHFPPAMPWAAGPGWLRGRGNWESESHMSQFHAPQFPTLLPGQNIGGSCERTGHSFKHAEEMSPAN